MEEGGVEEGGVEEGGVEEGGVEEGDVGGRRVEARGKLKVQSEEGCRTATSVDLTVAGVACLVF